ncbi:3-oxoacyl-[acyl-carrier-protein] synthase III C-terminal domain-containing protein [Actinacidiphila yeochonensis]|uniref:3-oxoacyl-[acyl-carrier-protein] synthase III C-terminal domain-containing protein n=1 Tax=Actinacidiphila yeochonensis TaxID=89050 RepID=UPI000565DBB1|nr:3-oxoacyl-[acyl-carrier-protein] synthase III C-terminal domain-containing protein [Actinacidiphila yeochonensis]
MTAIEEVAVHLPSTRVPVAEVGRELGLSDKEVRVFERFYGLRETLYEPDATLSDLALAAAGKVTSLIGEEDRVRYVIQARTLSVVVPYPVNPVQEVRDALGLRQASAFSVTQHACASGLLAVDLAGRLLAADGDPDARALVLTGEKAFTPTAQMIPNTTFMGEGSAAVLVRADGDRDRVLSYATRTHGQFNGGLSLTPERSAEFQAIYQDALAEVITAAVDSAGITLGELDLLLPHNVNRHSWMRLCKAIGYPPERIYLDNVPVTGHCFCADSFINYRSAADLGLLRPGDRYLMAAVGLGATFSAMVLEH